MAVRIPSRYGVILRTSALSQPVGPRVLSLLDRLTTEFQDTDLLAASMANSLQEALVICESLEHGGLVRGRDFVLSQADKGIVGPMPSWLKESMSATGNPPELEARMPPEVRAMWEATRVREYSFLPDLPGRPKG